MKLATRFMLAMIALVLVIVTAMGAFNYWNLQAVVATRVLAQLENHIKLVAIELDTAAKIARTDVLSVATLPAVASLVLAHRHGGIDPSEGTPARRWRERVATYLAGQIALKPSYVQYRLIGLADGGRELVGVDRVGDGVKVVPEAALQKKGDRGYFKEAIRLAPGAIMVSPIELNLERGAVETPHLPVMRVATPIHAADGEVFGIAVVDVDMRANLAAVRAAAVPHAAIYVANGDGDYLLHPDRAHEFGFDLGRRWRIGDDLPGLGDLLAFGASGSLVTHDARGAPLGAAFVSSRIGNGPRISVIETLPYTEMVASVSLSQQAGVAAAVVAAAIVASVIGARALARPLVQMAAAVAAIRRGGRGVLPVDAGGEVGTLARAFERFTLDIVGQTLSEEKFRIAVEASPSGMIMTDEAGKIVLVNSEAERLFGYGRAELIGRSVDVLVPAAARGTHRAHRSGFVAFPKTRRIGAGRDLYGLRKDGREFPIEIALNPIRTCDGLLVLSAVADITERKAAEERFRLAVEASPSGMIMTDEAGKIVLLNSEAERLFGYARDELIGQSVDLLVPLRTKGGHAALRAGFAARPEARRMGAGRDLYGLRKDGNEVPIEIALTPIRTKDGLMVVSSVVDISERKRSERALAERSEELQRSNAELEQFAYVASHDLQEPLRMVASYTALLAERYHGRLDDKADRYIAYAVDGATRMQALVRDLLTYAHVGTQGRALSAVPSQTALGHVLDGLKIAIEEAHAEVTSAELPVVKADELQLQLVFQNLIGNAIKFHADRPPRVSVGAERGNGEWIFHVADNGIGIDKQHSERVFDMFQRLHERGKYPGSGIGLAIAKKIVERHGGRIWLDSVPDQGTTFYFTMPDIEEAKEDAA